MNDSFDSLLQELGLPGHKLNDLIDGPAPEPVDDARILAFLQAASDVVESKKVAELIAFYKDWREAAARLADEEYARLPAALDEDLIQEKIDGQLAPFLSRDRPLSECRVPEMVDTVKDLLLEGADLTPQEWIQFYQLAASYIDQLLVTHARTRLADNDGNEAISSATTMLASDQSTDTVFPDTPSDAQQTLLRQRKRDEIKEYAADAVQFHSLNRFVPEERIAAWFDMPVQDVNDRIAFVEKKLLIAQAEEDSGTPGG